MCWYTSAGVMPCVFGSTDEDDEGVAFAVGGGAPKSEKKTLVSTSERLYALMCVRRWSVTRCSRLVIARSMSYTGAVNVLQRMRSACSGDRLRSAAKKAALSAGGMSGAYWSRRIVFSSAARSTGDDDSKCGISSAALRASCVPFSPVTPNAFTEATAARIICAHAQLTSSLGAERRKTPSTKLDGCASCAMIE